MPKKKTKKRSRQGMDDRFWSQMYDKKPTVDLMGKNRFKKGRK